MSRRRRRVTKRQRIKNQLAGYNEKIHAIHHRKPKSLNGKFELKNLSVVAKEAHAHWHAIFGNNKPEQIVEIINELFIDADYRIELIKL